MTINEYQKAALRTTPFDIYKSQKDQLFNGLLGLCGESGEAIDIIKKWAYQNHPLDEEHLARELGDIAWYIALTADAIGYDLETIFRMNIEKLKARYPEGFSSELSVNRATDDI